MKEVPPQRTDASVRQYAEDHKSRSFVTNHAGQVGRKVPAMSQRFLFLFVNLFIISCVFDPADKLFGMKVPLFCACWIFFSFVYLLNPGDYKVPFGLAIYVFGMISIPIWSIGYYYLTNGGEPFEGFGLLKAYFFITFAILLYLLNLDLVKSFSTILSILAILIIGVYILTLVNNSFIAPIQSFGNDYGIINIDDREYAPGLKVLSIFFVTSPMLVIPICYYTHLALTSPHSEKLLYVLLALLNISAMFVAGTRNNMMVSVLLPAILIATHSRKRILAASIVTAALIFGIVRYWDEITILLSTGELSNSTKIATLADYTTIFSDPVNLIFGQGLGAYHYWTAKGYYFYISELTYLELFRSFGLFLGTVMLLMMLYPIYYSLVNPRFSQKYLIVAYVFYLVACITNPLFFSSMGISLLSIVLANIFMFGKRTLRNTSLQSDRRPIFLRL